MITRPCGLNLMIMFEPSSTTQMLSSRIDAHSVRHLEGIQPVADLAHKLAGLVEFKQTRAPAAREYEKVSLGIGSYARYLRPDTIPSGA